MRPRLSLIVLGQSPSRKRACQHWRATLPSAITLRKPIIVVVQLRPLINGMDDHPDDYLRVIHCFFRMVSLIHSCSWGSLDVISFKIECSMASILCRAAQKLEFGVVSSEYPPESWTPALTSYRFNPGSNKTQKSEGNDGNVNDVDDDDERVRN